MAYSGRTGPNVSEYIANLNAIPPTAAEATNDDDELNFDADLAMFTNTQFFDYDLGQDTDLQSTNFGVDGQDGAPTVAPDSVDLKSLEFMNGDFSFPDFNNFSQPSFDNAARPLAPINTSQSIYPASSSAGSPGPAPQSAGTKRKADSVSSPQNIEDASRVAAEEDKRRRNTAASARFRVKKKQREQALERSAKEMSDKVSALEGRINQLETENKWLKNLITEKNDSKDDLAVLWKKYSENEARKGAERTDGVGTDA
ncbi:uncharacterized protein LY89DRAFT_406120 [Mollisia scopiformis]|uniref:BZIP domain-containing protein n=1 Tax=Mollisia scopiformis TaxID=149040 RepID=A0A132B2G9_MOLSC|nr:uncharacterized protein LY89DRAFT_406120 [Mollisia scopiformis]KUJ06582.1 hypothetical protein LY89DRAFT_406120 [Mollisia scopiformis]